jgi:hypothetical protein
LGPLRATGNADNDSKVSRILDCAITFQNHDGLSSCPKYPAFQTRTIDLSDIPGSHLVVGLHVQSDDKFTYDVESPRCSHCLNEISALVNILVRIIAAAHNVKARDWPLSPMGPMAKSHHNYLFLDVKELAEFHHNRKPMRPLPGFQ